MKAIRSNWFIIILGVLILGAVLQKLWEPKQDIQSLLATTPADSAWSGPSLYLETETTGEERELLIYGQELIANTALYLGPKGKVASLTNGMNCQNCHLDGGTRAWGITMVRSILPTRSSGTEADRWRVSTSGWLIVWNAA